MSANIARGAAGLKQIDDKEAEAVCGGVVNEDGVEGEYYCTKCKKFMPQQSWRDKKYPITDNCPWCGSELFFVPYPT